MANRPVFLPIEKKGPLFREVSIEFDWHKGMAPSQKRKNVVELHVAAQAVGISPILEVSTKSDLELGRRLSAFRLDVELHGIRSKIECVYQASKVFEKGGPFPELVEVEPIIAKRFFKEKSLGLITHFEFRGVRYKNRPFHAYYDWLFVRALSPHQEFLKKTLAEFEGYSDIEFNPSKSINTQARSVAIFHSLLSRGDLSKAQDDYLFFQSSLEKNEKKHSTQIHLGFD
ncbi:DarT1-associated NADAR antitoxin family protein [Hyphomonas sp. NPDC076900]|uniref:DarT1-associated NADAR antitoxin family protein n=1 Tax=unclassified Hyphomonas TaxID=2630699 RepID=UPI003D00061C